MGLLACPFDRAASTAAEPVVHQFILTTQIITVMGVYIDGSNLCHLQLPTGEFTIMNN